MKSRKTCQDSKLVSIYCQHFFARFCTTKPVGKSLRVIPVDEPILKTLLDQRAGWRNSFCFNFKYDEDDCSACMYIHFKLKDDLPLVKWLTKSEVPGVKFR